MSPLSKSPPRPRTRTVTPRYPCVTAVGVLMITASCGRTEPAPHSAHSATTTQVLVPVETAPAPPPDPAAGTETAPPIVDPHAHFPEDDEPLAQNVGCRGDCPPPYEMATRQKDRSQIAARVRYCSDPIRIGGDPGAGGVTIKTAIGPDGKATKVGIEPTGSVSNAVEMCIRTMVEAAPFSTEHELTRTVHSQEKIGGG